MSGASGAGRDAMTGPGRRGGLPGGRPSPKAAHVPCDSARSTSCGSCPGEPAPPHVGRDQDSSPSERCRSGFCSGRPGSRSASWPSCCWRVPRFARLPRGISSAAALVARRGARWSALVLALVAGGAPESTWARSRSASAGSTTSPCSRAGPRRAGGRSVARLDDAAGRAVARSRQASRPSTAPTRARRRARRGDRAFDPVPAVAARGGEGAPGGTQGPPSG